MMLFLDVISPKPKFVLIDNNKIIESLYILDQNCMKISDSIQNKFLKLQKKNNLVDFLDYLVVCTGPGSYTSLRVGISFMLGISYSKNIPIYGLSCIDLLSQSILKKDFAQTIILICSANNQNFICVPRLNEYSQYKTSKINDKYMFDNINLNIYSKCISNYPLPSILKKEIILKIKHLENKNFEDNVIQYSAIILKKQSILQAIYISENKLFN